MSDTIVKNFNVLKNIGFSLCFGLIVAMMHQFSFQGPKETFHRRVVVTIAGAAHTTTYLIVGHQSLIIVTCILAALIRVVQQARRGLAHFKRHLQRGDDQVAFQAIAHGPADNPARVQIQDHGQVQPAFSGRNVGNICQPFSLGRLALKS